MNNNHVIKKQLLTTDKMHFLWGSFISDVYRIPYFTTSLSYREVADYLTLFSDLKNIEAGWKIEELLQRDISWGRVKNDIVPYLKSPKPIFFNGLTVVLLPKKIDGSMSVSFDGEDWQPPLSETGNNNEGKLLVGPIEFSFYDDKPEIGSEAFLTGQMRWNKNQVVAVAIDGQHRVAAIKEIVNGGGILEHNKELDSRVPVLFLLFDKKVGFEGGANQADLQIVRKIFVDLNSHAEKVSRTRQILLDDNDPRSLCVKKLMMDEMTEDFASLTNPQGRKLPLSLVDWHSSNSAKIDSGPYLTTVLLLDQIIGSILGLDKSPSSTDYDVLRKQLVSLSKALVLEFPKSKKKLDIAEQREQMPFQYDESELKLLVERFAVIWNEPIINLYSNFAPYKDLIDFRSRESASVEWQVWHQLRTRKEFESGSGKDTKRFDDYQELLSQKGIDVTKYAKVVEEASIRKKGSAELPFKVIFQKALFETFKKYIRVSEEEVQKFQAWANGNPAPKPNFGNVEEESVKEIENVEAPEYKTEEDLTDLDVKHTNAEVVSFKRLLIVRSNELVNLLNALYQANRTTNLFNFNAAPELEGEKIALWQGSFFSKDSNTVDFTKAAGNRASDLLFALVMLQVVKKSGKPEFTEFKNVWPQLIAPVAVDRGFMRSLSNLIRRISGDDHLATFVLKNRDEEYTLEGAQDEIRKRLEIFWPYL
jgi:DGQHR domain-containing protein